MFIRFVIQEKDRDSRRRQGLFQAMSDLEYARVLLPHEQQQYDQTREWFRWRLRKPRRFARSSKPNARNVALSWFRASATEHISRMHVFARILHSHGMSVEMLRTERPGYVVYEDEFQVAAEPFRETVT